MVLYLYAPDSIRWILWIMHEYAANWLQVRGKTGVIVTGNLAAGTWAIHICEKALGTFFPVDVANYTEKAL